MFQGVPGARQLPLRIALMRTRLTVAVAFRPYTSAVPGRSPDSAIRCTTQRPLK